jgi:hypothetical protein
MGKVSITGVICPWGQRGVRGDYIVRLSKKAGLLASGIFWWGFKV